MDISLILISGLLIACVVVPVLLFIFMGNSDKKRLVKRFDLETKQNNLNIKNKEIWGGKIIGIDPEMGKILFIVSEEEQISSQLVDFATLTKCEPVVDFSITKEKQQILENVELQMEFKDSSPVKLNFYSSNTSDMPNFEVERVKKWCGIIRQAS